jgi:DNA-binding transcriptional MerR regulator
MEEVLGIQEVVRRTGLTSRALRFYDARGLVKPLRTDKGRRLYGPGELERINQIVALKRAGLTLAQIQRLTARRPLDLAALVDAQLEALDAQARDLAEARALLLAVKSRIDRGEPKGMEAGNWKKVTDRYFSAEEKAHWAGQGMPDGFDQEAYGRSWSELSARIEAALPLDPASAEAQSLLDEWNALLEPFRSVATPEMMAGAANLYSRMDEWRDEQQPPFSMAVWRFIQEARKARGG